MTKNIFILERLVEELQILIGCQLNECFFQDKKIAIISLSDGEKDIYLEFIADNRNDSLFINDKFTKAKSNIQTIFAQANGDILQSVELVNQDRIISLNFIKFTIFITLFGHNKSNMYLLNRKKEVISTFDKSMAEVGYNDLVKPLYVFDLTVISLKKYINNVKKLGEQYGEEFCLKNNIDNKLSYTQLTTEDRNKIENNLIEFITQIRNKKKYYILENTDGERILSQIHLSKYPIIINEYLSINTALNDISIYRISTTISGELKDKIELQLRKQYNKICSTLIKTGSEDEFIIRADKYRNYGELLFSQKELKARWLKEIELLDWESKKILIPLNEKMDLRENAENYFLKAKKTAKELEVIKKRTPELIAMKEKIEIILERLSQTNKVKELKKFPEIIKSELGIKVKLDDEEEKNPNKTNYADKFRKFDIGEGYFVYVGRDSKNNDELTVKFSKPNDIWLHARSVGGSHCVIKSSSSDKVPKRIIEKAAEIAAYYSQARNGKYVPVIFTFKKYVNKPKGANPGAVTVSREEVVMVNPRLPEGGD